MGRNRIKIERISNHKQRITTFNKRKTGLFKKAYELSELTGANVTLMVRGENGKNFMFSSGSQPLNEITRYEY